MNLVRLELQRGLGRHLRAGHPWVFRKAVEKLPRIPPGSVVDLTEGGKFVARGYFDPLSPIAVQLEPDQVHAPAIRARSTARPSSSKPAPSGARVTKRGQCSSSARTARTLATPTLSANASKSGASFRLSPT